MDSQDLELEEKHQGKNISRIGAVGWFLHKTCQKSAKKGLTGLHLYYSHTHTFTINQSFHYLFSVLLAKYGNYLPPSYLDFSDTHLGIKYSLYSYYIVYHRLPRTPVGLSQDIICLQCPGGGGRMTSYIFRRRMYTVKIKNVPKAGQIIRKLSTQIRGKCYFFKECDPKPGKLVYM